MNAVQIERWDKYEKKKKVKISEGKRWTDMFKLSLAYKTYSINSYDHLKKGIGKMREKK